MDIYQETLDFIYSKINDFKPEIAVILGSGLSDFNDDIEGIAIKYNDIPNFAYSNVVGHKGELLFAKIENKNCVIMNGRFHYYEGNSMSECTYPVKIFKKLGVKTLVVTNAAGALRDDYKAGDIVLIDDHINFMGYNPLIGKNDNTMGERFPDMTEAYSPDLKLIANNCAKELDISFKQGIYLATVGPSYETKAEVKMFRQFGADLVGMSSIPEVIVANYLKINVLGLSLVTNLAAGISDSKLSHEEVIKIGKTAGKKMAKLIKLVIKSI